MVICNRSVYLEYTDLNEPFGVDESWLDVTASEMLLSDAENHSRQYKRRVYRELGLTLSTQVYRSIRYLQRWGSDYKET